MAGINERDFNKMDFGDLNYYLLKNMKDIYFEEETVIMDNTLFIPKYSLSIRPNVVKADDNMAVINYNLYSEKWDREIFECSASLGIDKKQAIGMAEGSFWFGLMSGIKFMMNDEYFAEIETEFNGKHCWKLYSSDIVGMGDIPETTDSKEIWKILENEIPKYLGNQKLSYIKVFAAKNGGDITGECRINDEPIKKLGELIAKYAGAWDTKILAQKNNFSLLCKRTKLIVPILMIKNR